MKVRRWHLIVIAASVAGVLWLLPPSGSSPPPDFTKAGFTSIHVEFRRCGEEPPVSASSSDPAVVAELAEVLRAGQSVVVCRCGALGHLEFRRPDGTSERVLLVPAHDDESVEFRVMERGRYRVSRERFLQVIAPLGIPPARWYASPDIEPPAAHNPVGR